MRTRIAADSVPAAGRSPSSGAAVTASSRTRRAFRLVPRHRIRGAGGQVSADDAGSAEQPGAVPGERQSAPLARGRERHPRRAPARCSGGDRGSWSASAAARAARAALTCEAAQPSMTSVVARRMPGLVSVPVLSMHSTSTRASPSIAANSLTRTRRRASRSAPAANATEVSSTAPPAPWPTPPPPSRAPPRRKAHGCGRTRSSPGAVRPGPSPRSPGAGSGSYPTGAERIRLNRRACACSWTA